MAAASCLLTEHQFLCSICLDVFTDPVAIPCGHNFCKKCITQHWNSNVQCLCPNCKRLYSTRPELQVNIFISELCAQFRVEAQKQTSSSSEQQFSKTGEVLCDHCTGTKLKALKSCLVCLSSYCVTHLKPHLTKSGLKKHQLIDPVEDLEERMCKKHDKPLELFCKTDQTCVCVICPYSEHKAHDFALLKEEYEEKKAELEKTEAEIQKMIQERELKMDDIKQSLELSKMNADREITEGVQIFTALKESVERGQAEFIKTIREKQETAEKQAEDFITQLDQEIADLKKRGNQVKQLSQSKDHLHLLQNFSLLNSAPPTKDWTQVSICHSSYEGTVGRAVIQLGKTLNEQMKKMFKAELTRIQQHSVNVTLDPNKVSITADDHCRCVWESQGFNSGKFYFEVPVAKWFPWTLGVTTTSKWNKMRDSRLNPKNGYWTVICTDKMFYFAAAGPSIRLSVKSKLMNVGVFVDYEQGLVSFYDADTGAPIYFFTGCCFTGKLHPFFSPCQNNGILQSLWSSSSIHMLNCQ